jgi:hypothetical protein
MRETERGREKERVSKWREKERVRKMERERDNLFLKVMTGALAPFSYLICRIFDTIALSLSLSLSVSLSMSSSEFFVYLFIVAICRLFYK